MFFDERERRAPHPSFWCGWCFVGGQVKNHVRDLGRPRVRAWGRIALVLGVAVFALPSEPFVQTLIVVDSASDDLAISPNGTCTLREALLAANRDVQADTCPRGHGADVVLLPPGHYTLSIAGGGEDDGLRGDLDIRSDVEIRGSGQGESIIDGAGLDRVVDVVGPHRVTLRDLTLRGGNTLDAGGGIAAGDGAVVLLQDVAVVDNAASTGGGIAAAPSSSMTLVDAVVADNRALGHGAGGIDSGGELNSIRTVVGGNADAARPSGIRFGPGAVATFQGSTLADPCSNEGGLRHSTGGNTDASGGTCGLAHPNDRNPVADVAPAPVALANEAPAIPEPHDASPPTQSVPREAEGSLFADDFESGVLCAWNLAAPASAPCGPVLAPVDDTSVGIGGTLEIQLTAHDTNGDPLTYSALDVPAHASLDPSTGLFTFTPTVDQIGELAITFGASDGTLSDSDDATITVEPSSTRLSGRVLDTNVFVRDGGELPVVGATVSLVGVGVSTKTSSTGRFTLGSFTSPLPGGAQVLDIDTSTANPAPDGVRYASFREKVDIVAGINNVIARAIYLPRIDSDSVTVVRPDVSTVVTNPNLDVTLTVPSHTAKAPDGSDFTGTLSISEVPTAVAPAPLPSFLDPAMLITIQPVGVTFSAPVPISFPNLDGLTPGSEVDLWSLNPATGTFIVVGRGQVSADGTRIDIVDGGIRAADWHFIMPTKSGAAGKGNSENQDPDRCETQASFSRAALDSGALMDRHSVVTHRANGEERGLVLMYNSATADPRPIVEADTTILRMAAVPQKVSAGLSVPGAPRPATVYYDTSGLPEDAETTVSVAVALDASSLETGSHPFDLRLTSHYAQSSVSSDVTGRILVHNAQASAFGAGWGIDGMTRLLREGASRSLIVDGNGGVAVFHDKGPFDAARFALPVAYPLSSSGAGAAGLVAADLDGDGTLDLATLHLEGSRVNVLYGSGGGAFDAVQSFPVGLVPSSLATGDLNDDGRADLVVSEYQGNRVAVLLSQGEAGFSSPSLVALTGASSLVLAPFPGDLDRDGFDDVVVAHGQYVGILLADGAGGFRPLRDVKVVSAVGVITSGDANDDGAIDLLFASNVSPTAGLVIGDGRGNFFPGPPVQLSASPIGAALGDLDGDGADDAVVSQAGNEIEVLRSDGAGSLAPLGRFPVATSGNVSLGDIDGDGFLDVATPSFFDRATSLLRGRGDGTFTAARLIPASDVVHGPDIATLADFDGSGTADVATWAGEVGFGGSRIDVTLTLPQPAGPVTASSPRADYTTLTLEDDGTFTRRLKDGTTVSYDADGLQRTVTTRTGEVTTYDYDAQQRLVSITEPEAFTTTLAYLAGRLSTITDDAGRVTTFEHDPSGNLIRITDPDSSVRELAYDSRHRMVSQLTPRGFTKTYTYDFAGRMGRVDRPDGSSSEVVAAQTVALVDPAMGLGTEANPAPVVFPEDLVGVATDGNGNERTVTTDRFGAATTDVDGLGRTTTTERDGDSNPTKLTRPNGAVETYTYDARGNRLTATEQAIAATTTFTYEPTFNQVTSVKNPRNNTTTLAYDAQGNLVTRTDAAGTQTTIAYADADCPGRPTSLTVAVGRPEQATTTFEYDAADCNLVGVVDPLGHPSAYAYDAAGNVTQTTDALGRVTRFRYDATNRLTKAIDATNVLPDPVCGTAGVTCFEYDDAGNLTQLTDARGGITAFEYDPEERVSRRIDPLGNAETFTYDGNGNLRFTTDRKGQVIELRYDAADQLVQKLLLPGTPDEMSTAYAYDLLGNLNAATDPDSALAAIYDTAGRLTSASTAGSPNQPSVVLSYTYDKNDNRLTMTDPTGQTSYVHDALDRLTSLTNPASQTITFTHDRRSRRTQLDRPNGVRTTYAYDTASELLSIVHQLTGQPTAISSLAYEYDDVGNRTTVDQVRSALSATPSLTYGYDSLDRLIQATRPVPAQPDETFDYDPLGNRLLRDGQSVAAVFDAGNRLLQDEDACYQYDLNGNQTRKELKVAGTCTGAGQVTEYEWDPENRLAAVRIDGAVVGAYRYDALGRRIEKVASGATTRYVYDREDIALEYDGTNALTARYTHGPGIDEPLVLARGGQSYFYDADALGTILDLTDSAGAVAKSYVYDSFGTIAQQSGAVVNPFTYTARELDPETGLYYYRARYYDSSAGRFLTQDPLRRVSPFGLYVYADDAPAVRSDPFGLTPCTPAPHPFDLTDEELDELFDEARRAREAREWEDALREAIEDATSLSDPDPDPPSSKDQDEDLVPQNGRGKGKTTSGAEVDVDIIIDPPPTSLGDLVGQEPGIHLGGNWLPVPVVLPP